MDEQNNKQEVGNSFQKILKSEQVKIQPCDTNINLGDETHFKRLELTSEQKIQINEIFQHLPVIIATGQLANSYKVSFPKGLPHTLMALRRGGFGSAIMDNGQIVGMASFTPMLGQAVVYGVFSLMSIITGQFFLKKINEKLETINQKVDKILRFMYGDKKAELLSEVSFVKYACDNYVSIMTYEVQRTATIIGIQEAKKIATKDIEFYLNDLGSEVKSGKNMTDLKVFKELVEKKILEIEKNLTLAIQLYQISSLMEIYYSQNFEENYIEYVDKDIKMYAKNYNDKIFTYYGSLEAYLDKIKASPQEDWDELKKKLEDAKLSHGEMYNEICDRLSEMVKSSTKSAYYYFNLSGSDSPQLCCVRKLCPKLEKVVY